MRTLHIISSLDPRGGGPREGLRHIAMQARVLGHTVEVVTLDDPSEPFLADFPTTVHALGPSYTKYAYCPRLVPWLRANAHRYDSLIVNGIWQYHTYGTWKALHNSKVPYFVFTHGMLDPWFKESYPLKHLKKWLFWPWAEYRLLRDARAVLFTCEEERRLARLSFPLYKVKEAVVSYGTSAPPKNVGELRSRFFDKFPELLDRRLILFLSRIHEKKGCDILIEAFAKVAGIDPQLHLVMAGPAEPELRARLDAVAAAHGVTDRISWPGMLQGDLKWGAFYASEVFALSSHQENFGIAVAEALGCGLPVLISNKVNIWREIEADHAGLVSADDVSGTISNLERWLGMSEQQRHDMASQAKHCFENRFTSEAMTKSLFKILKGE